MKYVIVMIVSIFFTNNAFLYSAAKEVLSAPAAEIKTKKDDDLKKEKVQKEHMLTIKKIDEDLYVSAAPDGSYCAMERITPTTMQHWLKYASLQSESELINSYLPSKEGATHLEEVVQDYNDGVINRRHELWVAYISTVPVVGKARLKTGKKDANPTIEMVMTVITSAGALLTSHMGITRTWEAAHDLAVLEKGVPSKKMLLSTRIKRSHQSLYLHAFAARVMKLRDAKKRYMLTAPLESMRALLIKKMPPHSVFIGDNIYKTLLQQVEKKPEMLLDDRDLKVRSQESELQRQQRLKKVAQKEYEYLAINNKIAQLRTHPPRITITNGVKKSFTIQSPDGADLLTFDESTSDYQWLFTDPYLDRGLDIPYVLVDLNVLVLSEF